MKNRFFTLIGMWLVATAALLAQSSKIYRVTPDGTETGNGQSWQTAMSLEAALATAQSGDKIYVKGAESGQVYKTPVGGFVLKSGVELYGGFKGERDNETPDEREIRDAYNRFRYAALLSGDVKDDDAITEEELLVSATRRDNREHVLVMDLDPTKSNNLNTKLTLLDGFSIAGGQATDFGGGVYVKGAQATGAGAYRIERCFFYNNYAPLGGAIYVDAQVKAVSDASFIDHCVLFNNMAGRLGEASNSGAGAYLAGCGYIVNTSIYNNVNGGVRLSAEAYLLNATVTRNTVAGVDMIEEKDAEGKFHVTNSIVWGNTTFSSDFRPGVQYSAFNEALSDEAQQGNIYVGSKNNDKGTPSLRFEAPSPTARYDVSFNATTDHYPEWSWNLMEGSAAIDKANTALYDKAIFGEFDLDKTARISGTAIDMGAFEYQYLQEGRIRYVKTDGKGDGASWENATKDLQAAIDGLYNVGGGEVWVAAGEYVPTRHIDEDPGNPVSFVMREGVSVYGGFDRVNPENSKTDRQVGVAPWEFKNQTILKGSYTGQQAPKLEWSGSRWNLNNGSSEHVVWFAPLPGSGSGSMGGFAHITVLDGVTITGGKAEPPVGSSNYQDRYQKLNGAGVFMADNAYLQNCIVTGNVASGNGGGIYMQGGRVVSSLVCNNGADGNGGGVYMNGFGLVLRSMLTNNSAEDGAACYFNHTQPSQYEYANYLILSTSVVSNNTARKNAAVYCNRGGVVMQSTLTNNHTVGNTDESNPDATTRTGGLYVNKYGSVINSLLWKNTKKAVGEGVEYIPLYVNGASMDKTQFLHCGVSSTASWEGSWQQGIVWLADTDGQEGINPRFSAGFPETSGVQPDLKEVDYYWQPDKGSNLRAKGLALGSFPQYVLFEPEIDIFGDAFPQTAGLGAFHIESQPIVPEETPGYIRIYVDSNNTDFANNGSSWNTPYASLSEAILHMASLPAEKVGGRELQIYVMEGTVIPKSASLDIDPRSCRIRIPALASGKKLFIKGGFSRENPANRQPDNYRTVIEGNSAKTSLNQGLYHCIIVEKGANVEFDGFHVNGGYAVSKAMMTYGAGMLVTAGAEATLRNCVFENHSAQTGAAVDAREAKLTTVNCVFSNNRAYVADGAVVNARYLIMQHCTMVNNIGKALQATGSLSVVNSFEMGQTNSQVTGMEYYTEPVDATMFLNPTTKAGPQLNYETAVGGYPLFKPTNLNPCVNKVTVPIRGLHEDLTGGSRSLGGAPDFGAYEAPLPADGGVLYVRENGNDANDGRSWNTPLRTITAALTKARAGMEIWVSGGTYTENVTMVEGVNVLGGFSKQGNPGNTLDGINRDLSHTNDQFKTVIQSTAENQFSKTGSLPQNSEYNFEDTGNKRVLTQSKDFTTKTTWEGFVITGGKTSLKEYGAGVYLCKNGHLLNCRVENNTYYECGNLKLQRTGFGSSTVRTYAVNDALVAQGGGGVLCVGGKVENCQIVENRIEGRPFTLSKWGNIFNGYEYVSEGNVYAKGAGLCISGGDIINCVIARNVVGWHREWNTSGTTIGLTHMLGCAAFVADISNFYNCTIVENGGGWRNSNEGPSTAGVWDEKLKSGYGLGGSYFYNCIIAGNYSCGRTWENMHQIGAGLNDVPKRLKYSFVSYVKFTNNSKPGNIDSEVFTDQSLGNAKHEVVLENGTTESDWDKFSKAYKDYRLLDANYNLQPQIASGLQNPCWNTGNSGYAADIYLDANGQNRVQDCVVDMGAYELSAEGNVKADADNMLYVTADGAGLRNGSSPENAACATKLQEVLNFAGSLAKNSPTQPVVKIAGYRDGANIYHPVVLLTETQPQLKSTFTVPYGVKVMGGYSEEARNWKDDNRAVNDYITHLSAGTRLVGNNQEVSGFHVLTFEPKPEGWKKDFGTLVDGVYLMDGKATAAGSEVNSRGGGAIVTDGIHLRNCVVLDNTAVNEGGGLYLMPGALVSGCVIKDNESGQGGGVYASNTGANASQRAHLYACTINGNTAAYTGGGTYFESGAAFIMNSVVFGNKASSNKNVGGEDLRLMFADDMTKEAYEGTNRGMVADDTKFYIFNGCAVEGYVLPGHLLNLNIGSDWEDYFNSETNWDVRAYSQLINAGVMNRIHEFMVRKYHVSAVDIAGNKRLDGPDKMDIGAYSFRGGYIATNQRVERIFVALKPADGTLDAGRYADDLGRSFFTPLTSLDVALEYIYRMRDTEWGKNTFFEIWMAKGTYKPTNQRPDAATELSGRQNSFVIPANVRIYGGFAGNELMADAGVSPALKAEKGLTPLTGEAAAVMQQYLNKRETADLNHNGLIEPWELANQTILSGNINADDANGKSYHVLFSDTKKYPPVQTAAKKQVLLDGVVVMDGQTANRLDVAINDEVGRGGGLYTNGVDYICHRTRFLNNEGVRGGAVYGRTANVSVIGCSFEGNRSIATGDVQNPSAGGAVYLSKRNNEQGSYTFRAVNSLFANNETAGYGGAIAENNMNLNLMNNTIVANKAGLAQSAIYSAGGEQSSIANTVFWANESPNGSEGLKAVSGGDGVVSGGLTVTFSHSAIDGGTATFAGQGNVLLGSENLAVDGPRFAEPTKQAGAGAKGLWNPAAISLLTEAGDSRILAKQVELSSDQPYYKWFELPSDPMFAHFRNLQYGGQNRFAGPEAYPGEVAKDKVIDIGMYEYQYPQSMNKLRAIYVDLTSKGDASGKDWNNATSDLQGAIRAATHPDYASQADDGTRAIYVRGADFVALGSGTGASFELSNGGADNRLHSLTIYGSCTGREHEQDFSTPTVIRMNAGNSATTLFNLNCSKPVALNGLEMDGALMSGVSSAVLNYGGTGDLTLKNVALRGADIGLRAGSTTGQLKAVNTLFADSKNIGLQTEKPSNATLVNNTFVKAATDMSTGITDIYNTVSAWCVTQHLPESNNNVKVAVGVENVDLDKGPNFVDPDKGDYRVRPSMKLTNQGNDDSYKQQAGVTNPATERDLVNAPRFKGTIDVGAYEFASDLSPVIYVKQGVVSDKADGSSWTDPMSDLQGAVDLASVYAKNEKKPAYVLVHRNVDSKTLSVTYPNVYVYGSFSDQEGVTVGTDGSVNIHRIESLPEINDRSVIENLNVLAESVVDGFELTGKVILTNSGMLSTSLVSGAVSGDAQGILYNSLVVSGTVSDVQAAWVTAVGTVALPQGAVHSRANAGQNPYVTDALWKYQLAEIATSDLEQASPAEIAAYVKRAGHEVDLAGNKRVRGLVDNGCFETWNVTEDTHVTDNDYPRGKSVVYVRAGKMLKLDKAYMEIQPFNPGFLLLEHEAGLIGQGNYVHLTNFAQERNLQGPASEDLMSVPFLPRGVFLDGVRVQDLNTLQAYYYDGAKRAAYDYKFETAGKNAEGVPNGAWKPLAEGELKPMMSLYVVGSFADSKVHKLRVMGSDYSEGGNQPKTIELMKYNYNEPWNSSTTGGNKFTHKENMSWNLVGSPFLSPMDLNDMDNRHVVYVQGTKGYETKGLDDSNYVLPAGAGMLTQTATLREKELLTIRTPKNMQQPSVPRRLSVALFAADSDVERADELVLNPVEAADAVQEFRVNCDGVKWMNADSIPQLYAMGDGGRYSLLSAVNKEGFVPVGIRVPYAGRYTMQLPSDCEWNDCEAVVLIDDKLQRTVDLTEGAYSFEAPASGEDNGRFRISFLRSAMTDDGFGVRVYSTQRGVLTVDGLQPGYQVRVFTPAGMLVQQLTAHQWQETFSCPAENVCLVRIDDADGRNICVRKVRL